jgi:hypothetical protein
MTLQFDANQRRALRRLDLLDEQIRQLETVALPLCAASFRPLPGLNEVRDELDMVTEAVRRADLTLKAVINARQAHFPVRFEVRQWIALTAYDQDKAPAVLISETSTSLSQMLELLRSTRSSLPREQRRSTAGDWRPVAFIAQALLEGFIRHHNPPPLPPYEIEVSKGAKSPFRRIVEVCYEAAGHPSTNAEKAIRAYQARKRRPGDVAA